MTGHATIVRRARTARPSFHADEARQPWLAPLLEAGAVVDAGVTEAIRREATQGRALACHKGCAACCRSHTTIPVYPLELIGITWYAVEKIAAPVRAKLMQQLREHQRGAPCPLLVDDACSIHPLRPVACRQFNVFGRVCDEGEDAYYTRRQDVLTPIQRYADAAFDVMLPFYGVKHKAERRQMIKTGAVHRWVQVLQEYAWPRTAERMTAFDERGLCVEPAPSAGR